jgi:hypothetical protein
MQAVKQSALSLDLGDLVAIAEVSALTPETRRELMDLAKRLRAAADSIDRITKVKVKKAVDDAGEPTFRFATKVALPDDFRMTKKMAGYAGSAGFSEKEAEQMLETFVTFYRKGGKTWQDWTLVWMDWVRREKKRVATAPKQRVSSGQLPKW